MKNEEKKFLKPEAEIVEFTNDDIITRSDENDFDSMSYPWNV